MSSPSAIVFEHGVSYLQVKIIHFWMHSCSYQRGRVFCSILCVYCFFTRSVNELSFGSMWCWKKGCTEKNSLAFLMGNCGLFLECINILILFTFFLQKYLTPTSLLPQTTQHFWLCSFLTLREIQVLLNSFRWLQFFPSHFANHFHFIIFLSRTEKN